MLISRRQELAAPAEVGFAADVRAHALCSEQSVGLLRLLAPLGRLIGRADYGTFCTSFGFAGGFMTALARFDIGKRLFERANSFSILAD